MGQQVGAPTANRSHSSILYRRSQYPAVGERNLAKINVIAAAFDAVANQGDLVPNLHGIFIPALAGQSVRTVRFGNPFFYFPRFVRNIEMDQRMGVGPLEFGHRPFHAGGGRNVVIRPAVMRERRPGKKQKTGGPKEHSQSLIFHLSILWDFNPVLVQNLMPAARWCQSHLASGAA